MARLAVPGPDPMPVWLTVVIGLVGVFVGGGVGFALGAEGGAFLGAVVCATLVVIAYRRVVQKRGVTGPDAKRRPTRGLGLGREPRSSEAAAAPSDGDAGELLDKLADLRDAGVVTPEEFEAKRRDLLTRR